MAKYNRYLLNCSYSIRIIMRIYVKKYKYVVLYYLTMQLLDLLILLDVYAYILTIGGWMLSGGYIYLIYYFNEMSSI